MEAWSPIHKSQWEPRFHIWLGVLFKPSWSWLGNEIYPSTVDWRCQEVSSLSIRVIFLRWKWRRKRSYTAYGKNHSTWPCLRDDLNWLYGHTSQWSCDPSTSASSPTEYLPNICRRISAVEYALSVVGMCWSTLWKAHNISARAH